MFPGGQLQVLYPRRVPVAGDAVRLNTNKAGPRACWRDMLALYNNNWNTFALSFVHRNQLYEL